MRRNVRLSGGEVLTLGLWRAENVKRGVPSAARGPREEINRWPRNVNDAGKETPKPSDGGRGVCELDNTRFQTYYFSLGHIN